MPRRTRSAALLTSVLALSLAACGGSSKAVTPASVAADVKCTDVATATTSELYVKEAATCTLNGKQVRILTFNDNKARDAFVDVAAQFGGSYDKHDRAVVEQS